MDTELKRTLDNLEDQLNRSSTILLELMVRVTALERIMVNKKSIIRQEELNEHIKEVSNEMSEITEKILKQDSSVVDKISQDWSGNEEDS